MNADRRRECLARMGLTVWVPRAPAVRPEAAGACAPATEHSRPDAAAGPAVPPPPARPGPGAAPAAVPSEPAPGAAEAASGPDARAPAAAGAQGATPAARPREAPGSGGASGAPAPAPEPPPVAALGWDDLGARVAGCRACALAAGRTQTVFGVGHRSAELMVVGEAPGEEEDRQGEPFVGRAGRLLNAMLEAIGRPRGSVYIANILKCRPPRNRDPLPAEVACCGGYLERQIALVEPRLILAVGRIAAQNLLGSQEAIGRMRGRVHRLPGAGLPVVVTYHPAYLLRSPGAKAKAWQDLKLAWRLLQAPEAVARGEAAAGEAAP